MENRIKWETYNGQKILKLDFSNLNGDDLLDVLEKVHEVITAHGSSHLIVMTNIHNVIFDRKTTKHFKAISYKNKAYVDMSIFYRVNTIQKMTIEAVGKLVDRQFHVFKSEEDLVVFMSTTLNKLN